MTSLSAPQPPQPDSSDELDLVAKFEHEYDVITDKFEIHNFGFDGRLGDPRTVLKRNLSRLVKYYLKRDYIAKADAVKAIDKLPTTGRDYPNVYVPLHKLKQVLKLEES